VAVVLVTLFRWQVAVGGLGRGRGGTVAPVVVAGRDVALEVALPVAAPVVGVVKLFCFVIQA